MADKIVVTVTGVGNLTVLGIILDALRSAGVVVADSDAKEAVLFGRLRSPNTQMCTMGALALATHKGEVEVVLNGGD
jgi:hypothetical protein